MLPWNLAPVNNQIMAWKCIAKGVYSRHFVWNAKGRGEGAHTHTKKPCTLLCTRTTDT